MGDPQGSTSADTGIPATDSSVLRVPGTRHLAVREVRSYCGNGEEQTGMGISV